MEVMLKLDKIPLLKDSQVFIHEKITILFSLSIELNRITEYLFEKIQNSSYNRLYN